MNDSRHSLGEEVAALKGAFESFAESVGQRMDRWERDVTGIAGRVEGQIKALREEMREEVAGMRGQYVTQDQFAPVKAIVYGIAGTALLAVITAVVGLVVLK